MRITNALQTDHSDIPETYLKTTFNRDFVHDLEKYLSNRRSNDGRILYQVGTSYSCRKDLLLSPEMANKSLARCYLKLCEYLAGSSRINRPWFRLIQPQMFSFMDIPGSKFKIDPVARRQLNNSPFHHHSILIADAQHEQRLDALLAKGNRERVRQNWADWCHLIGMDFQKVGPTQTDIRKVVDYASGHARKFLNSHNRDFLSVFPKSDSEFKWPVRR